ncbi:hypothetical protein GALMADRAFT_243024 [Galerina marginata CBS 339.88]|uniref:Uncharacterized protein n=1 Tax=Galerina marginata (strain CBS 339.88) TaxID=685588 RepID=A0A067T9V1_GALM3|nr:hypothetical protein GALMADRAFT_243024 [Galerina marginata CBS 339.88]
MSATLPYLEVCMSESECTAQAVDHIAVKELWMTTSPGNVIGVRVCARFAGCNNATKGMLTMAYSGTEDPTTEGGNQDQNQGSHNEPSVGSDGYISFLNLTAKNIKIRLTATNDTGSENFFDIPARQTGKWERALMQLAFVFRTDSNETLTLAVQPGKLYTIGGDLAMPEPDPKATNLNVTGTISTFALQGQTTKSFVARFEVEALGGRELVFPASSAIALPLFDADVTMSYANEMDLSGHRAFTGVIGLGRIALRTDNDVTLVGKLTKGGPDYLLEFAGSANWTLSQVIMPPIEIDEPKAFLIPVVADSGEEGRTESGLTGEDI